MSIIMLIIIFVGLLLSYVSVNLLPRVHLYLLGSPKNINSHHMGPFFDMVRKLNELSQGTLSRVSRYKKNNGICYLFHYVMSRIRILWPFIHSHFSVCSMEVSCGVENKIWFHHFDVDAF